MTSIYADQAIFAMGCFWSAETVFRDHESNALTPGINSIQVGYAGGTNPEPTYENHVGYKEAVKIDFDPKKISYEKLLSMFWHNIDPFDIRGQFCDYGPTYMTEIFYTNNRQKSAAEKEKVYLAKKFKKKVATEINPATTFVAAEEEHQNYSYKNPALYKTYRWGCGRDRALEEIWK